jgi:hypothetical protein
MNVWTSNRYDIVFDQRRVATVPRWVAQVLVGLGAKIDRQKIHDQRRQADESHDQTSECWCCCWDCNDEEI